LTRCSAGGSDIPYGSSLAGLRLSGSVYALAKEIAPAEEDLQGEELQGDRNLRTLQTVFGPAVAQNRTSPAEDIASALAAASPTTIKFS
jgi:hypothetical protein